MRKLKYQTERIKEMKPARIVGMKLLTSMRIVLMTTLALLLPNASPTNEGTIPEPTYKKTNCRLLINEVNLFTEDSMAKQFVELGRYCPNMQAYQKTISMTGVKLIFIDYKGYLVSVCELNQYLVPKVVVIPRDKKRGIPKQVRKHWLYVIGKGYDDLDYLLDDCQIVPFFHTPGLPLKFWVGVDYPIGIAIVYNKALGKLNEIKLEAEGGSYKRKKITPAIQKQIKDNLQDFYILGAKTRYQYCNVFDSIYPYSPSRHVMIRDWNVEGQDDRSMSRCSSREAQEIYPMQPQLWSTTKPTPGEPNACKAGVKFYIEDFLTQREMPFEYKYGTDSKLKCLSYTTDPAEVVGYVTHPDNYKEKQKEVEEAFTASLLEVEVSTVNQDEGAGPSSRNPDIVVDDNTESSAQRSRPAFIANPISTAEFENGLEANKPYIWTDDDCTRFPEAEKTAMRQMQGTPIDMNRVLKPGTCNWFQYIIPTKLFRCRLCHSLLYQGIIFDRPKSSHITDIMKAGVLNQNHRSRIWMNTKFINDHEKSIFHEMAVQWFTLFDKGLRGPELEHAFKYKPGAFYEYMKTTKDFMITVKQAVRLGLPFRRFQILTDLLVYFNVKIGKLFQNFSGMKAAIEVMSEKMHEDMCKELILNNAPISILLDGTTDLQTIPVVAVLFQTNTKEGGLKIVLYKILKMEKGEGGKQIFEAFMKEVKKDGLEDYLRVNLHSATSDGALNVLKTFNEELNKFTEQVVMPVWCGCHVYDLIYKRTVREYSFLAQISTTINSCSKFFKLSSKRKQILKEVAQKHKVKPFTIKKTHAIRWVNGNIRALRIVLEKWLIIIEALERINAEKSFDSRTRAQALDILLDLKDPEFLSNLSFLTEIGKVFNFMSLKYQVKGTTLISKQSLRNDFKNKLEGIKNAELATVKKFLIPYSTFTVGDEKINVVDLKTFETEQVEFHGVKLLTPDQRSVGKRLFEKQATYIEHMLEDTDFYFAPNIQDSFEVFNPLNFPTSGRLGGPVEPRLDNYGKAEITKLNRGLKWGFDNEALLTAWSALVKGVQGDMDFEEYKLKTPEQFWNHYLKKGDKVGFNEMTTTIISKALTVSSSNAESERVLGMYSGVKTYQRFLLHPETVESLLRIRINSEQVIDDREALEYATAFLLKGHMRTDEMERRKRQIGVKEWDDMVAFDTMDSNIDDIGGENEDNDGEEDGSGDQ